MFGTELDAGVGLGSHVMGVDHDRHSPPKQNRELLLGLHYPLKIPSFDPNSNVYQDLRHNYTLRYFH